MKKPLALFTISRNEGFFLPRWLKHYGQAGGILYVLDHESDDGSTEHIDAHVIQVKNKHTDDVGWMLRTVEQFQRDLLNQYDRVVFAEVDEFLVPDPDAYTDLGEYLARNDFPQITASGYSVCERPGDPKLDPKLPITAQRGWKRDTGYDKTLISSSPLCWQVGFHLPFAGFPRPNPDPNLLLVHLHYADREIAWNRLLSRMAGRESAPGDWSSQNKERDRAKFDQNFDAETANSYPIGETFRGVL